MGACWIHANTAETTPRRADKEYLLKGRNQGSTGCAPIEATGRCYSVRMDQNKILDSVIRPLADLYEGGNRGWQPIEPESTQEYEPLREFLAKLVAEGSLIREPHVPKLYRLTDKGYSTYKA